jgi:glutaredoxin 3
MVVDHPSNGNVYSTGQERSELGMNQMEVVLYTKDKSFRCWRAKRLLRRKGYAFEVVNVLTYGGEGDARIDRTISQKRVPFVFVDGRPVGGFDVIMTLDRSGTLDRLVRGEV